MNGARTVRMTIGIHERRRINPSVGHWMWPLVKEFCLYWNHTKVYYQLFSIEKCALSVAKAPAAMQLSRSHPHRANKEHLSLTLFKVCSWDGSLQSPEAPTECILSLLIVSQKLSLRMSEGGTRSRIMSEGGTRSRTCSESSDVGEATGLLVILCFTTFVQKNNFSWQLAIGLWFRPSEDHWHQLWLGWKIQFYQG